MDQIVLNTTTRTVIGKQVRALRRHGQVPLVMYGAQTDAVSLQADAKELARVLRQAGGSRLIAVSTGGRMQNALARAVQREPISGQILHVDLLAVSMTERITVEVPIVLEGKSPAVRRGEGVLVTGIGSIEIECLPGDLIDNIRVDLERLASVGDALYVKDLNVPATVEVLTDLEEMVARVTYLAAEEVAPVEALPTEAEPEVIARGKVEEEGEEE